MDITYRQISIALIISVLLYFSGCHFPTEQEVQDDYSGKWELVYLHSSDSSVYIHNTWLTLNKDQTFHCTYSVFWIDDSSKGKPLNGTWLVVQHYEERREISRDITFTVDSVSKTWDISEQKLKTKMSFNNTSWQYIE